MSSQRTILLYTDESTAGGVAHYNHSLLPALIAAGWRTCSAQPPNDSPMLNVQRDLGVIQRFLSYEPMTSFTRSFTDTTDPERIMAEIEPDLVYFSDCCPLSNLAAKHVAITRKIPFVIISHSGADYLAQRFAACLPVAKRQLELAQEVIAISQKNLDILRSHFGLPATKGVVVLNGRPPPFFTPPDPQVRQRIRAELQVPDDGVLCFTSARFDAAKGYQHQLAAIRSLQSRGALGNFYFAWAGTGEMKAEIEKAITAVGLDSRIRLLGQRWDIAALLDGADLFVLTTMLEGGLPLSVMEAMAKGVATIVTSVNGIAEVAQNASYLLPDPNTEPEKTASALAEALEELSRNPIQRSKFGQAGRALAERQFRQETNLAKTLALLERSVVASDRRNDVTVSNAAQNQPQVRAVTRGIPASIIVSTHESVEPLGGCLEGLVAQTLFQQGQLEIVVVDSGGSANRRAVFDRFQRNHKNLVLIAADPNLTVHAARNIGINAANGTYITVANTNDRHRRNAFELMKLALDERSDASLVYANCYISDTPDQPFDENSRKRRHRNPDYFPPSALLTYQFGPQPMWRKSVHSNIGWFDETLERAAADQDFNLRFAQQFNALHLPAVFGQYLESPASRPSATARPEVALVIQRHRNEETIQLLYGRAGVSITTQKELALVYNDLGIRSARYFRPEGAPESDPEFAMQCFLWSIERDPDQISALNNLFCILAATGNLSEANSLVVKAGSVTRDPIFQANIERASLTSAKTAELQNLIMMPSSLSLPTEEELNTTADEIQSLGVESPHS